MSKTQKPFQNLTLIVIGPTLAQFNPILPVLPLDMYEGVGILSRPENKSCLKVICTIFDIGALNDPHIFQTMNVLLFLRATALLWMPLVIH